MSIRTWLQGQKAALQQELKAARLRSNGYTQQDVDDATRYLADAYCRGRVVIDLPANSGVIRLIRALLMDEDTYRGLAGELGRDFILIPRAEAPSGYVLMSLGPAFLPPPS